MEMVDRENVIARLEHLRQEYNLLAQYLTSAPLHDRLHQSHANLEGLVCERTSAREREGNAVADDREVQTLVQQLNTVTSERGALERKLQHKENEKTKALGKLRQEVKEYANETEVLKDIVKRLNEQLNRYHLKYGHLGEEKSEKHMLNLSRSGLYKLGALLTAYDELLLERDTALKSNTERFEKLMVKVDTITTENEKLHARLERFQNNAPLGSEEAEMVAADARLLLEEREILLQEVQLLRQQKQEESAVLTMEVTKLQHKLEDQEIRTNSLTSELSNLRADNCQLEKQNQALHKQLIGSVTKQEHQLAVDECQRLFEELRSTYKQESGNLKGKMQAVKHEKKHLAEKLTDTSTHVHNLSVQVSGLKSSLRKTESRIERRERTLQALHTSQRLAQSRLKTLTQVCSELLEDREKLLEAVAAQQRETEELSKEVKLRSAAVGALSHKLKEERVAWSDRFAECEGGRKAAKAAWKRSSREASHLRSLVTTKDDTIASLLSDYKILGLSDNGEKHRSMHPHISKHVRLPGRTGTS